MRERIVAIQGEAGSFSHAAALALFGCDIRLAPCVTFDDLFRAVSTGSAACGAVPIENTLAGSVSRNYDLLGEHGLQVIGETRVRVRLCLAVRPGTTLTDIHGVASHPVALEQCRRFFATHPGMQPVPTYDTAGGVRDLMAGKSAAEAAIGSALAAELYGAAIALQGIEDHAENYTRFLAISREVPYADEACKATLVFTLNSVPGALHGALGTFAERGFNLTRIESRPIPGRPWEYAFYVDVQVDRASSVNVAVSALRRIVDHVQVLGIYGESRGPD